jgi:hypothetical protein
MLSRRVISAISSSSCCRRKRGFALAALLLCSLLAPGFAAADDRWQAIHAEMHDALAEISRVTFRSAGPPDNRPLPPQPQAGGLPTPWMIVVGFTGGIEGGESAASGVVAMRRGVGQHMGERAEVVALTYNNFYWQGAARDVLRQAEEARSGGGSLSPLPQPLIVVYGHSWGAGSIAKFARELRQHGLEVSLAIYIDSFTLRNPRLPDNVRYAVNFYQRSGLLRGLPFRGKRQLIPEDPGATTILGEYRIKPKTEHWGWSWNIVQPLLYRHHHRIGHDLRLQRYLLEVINFKLQLLDEARETQVAHPRPLFDRVVILGASVSADERAPSPGYLLSRHLGTPAERIHTFAAGGASSSRHLPFLDNIARLQPTLILALDLFYHDFKASLFLTEAKKKYIRDYIARLHDTGAVVVVGNVPPLVLLRHHHVNRYLEELAAEFPNLALVDVDTLLHAVEKGGFPLTHDGQTIRLTKDDLFADRVHPNLLGSTIMANLLQEALRGRFPQRWPLQALPLPWPLPLPGDGKPESGSEVSGTSPAPAASPAPR